MNNTSCEAILPDNFGQQREEYRILLIIFLSCLPCLAVAGNVFVIYIVCRRQRFRQRANVFVVSLAVADLAVAILVMPFSILNQFVDLLWLNRKSVRWLYLSLDISLTSTSILNLMCMTVDRYVAICLPFIYSFLMKHITVAALVIVCWSLPMVFSFGLIFNEVHIIGIASQTTGNCTSSSTVILNDYYMIIGSVMLFYIPSLFMLICNIKIFMEVRLRGRKLCELFENSQREQHDKLMKREIKVARTIVILLSCFFLCWLPFFIVSVLQPILNFPVTEVTDSIITWLGYANSIFNPFLYYFFNKSSDKGCGKCCTWTKGQN